MGVDYGTPYNGPHQMPGTIEAEDFNGGGAKVGYYATTIGNQGNSNYRNTDVDIYNGASGQYVTVSDIASADIDEWLNYTFEIATAGWYKIYYTSRSIGNPTQVWTLIDDRELGASYTPIPTTVGYYPVKVVHAIYLTAGTHNLKIAFLLAATEIDSITFLPTTAPAVITPTLHDTATDVFVADIDATQPPYNADNTGGNDARSAIQTALEDMDAIGGGTVFLPAGIYKLNNYLLVKSGVTLAGDWRNPLNGGLGTGTILKIEHGGGSETGFPAVMLYNDNSTVRNLSIWYPYQDASNVTPYPYSIEGYPHWGYTVKNITLYNSYNGVNIRTGSGHTIGDIYGTVLRRGIATGHGFDFSFVYNVNFQNYFWNEAPADVITNTPNPADLADYTHANLEGVRLGHNDGQMVYNIAVQDAKEAIQIKRTDADDAADDMGAFWGVLSKINGEIFEYNGYVWAGIPYLQHYVNHHFINTDWVPETASMHYEIADMPRAAKTDPGSLYDVKFYGAMGDGLNDDTTAIQNALNAAGTAGGGVVYLPLGQYKIMTHLSVPSGVELRGGHGAVQASAHTEDCILLAYEGKGTPNPDVETALITLNGNGGARGFSIVYPEQSYGSNVSPYPYAFRGNGSGVWIVDIDFKNAYNGIDFVTNQCDDHLAAGIWGTVHNKGIDVGGGSQGGKLERIVFHYGPGAGSRRQNAPHLFGFTDYKDQVNDDAVIYRFGDCAEQTTYGICSFQNSTHMHIYGNCTDSTFWLNGADVPFDELFLISAGDNINFVGPLTMKGHSPWLKTEATFSGTVNVYDYLKREEGFNSWENNGGTINFYNEKALTTAKPATASDTVGGDDAARAVDRSDHTKWVGYLSAGNGYLEVDLQQPSEIIRWQLKSAGFNNEPADGSDIYNTDSATLQYSTDGVNFYNADSFSNNDYDLIDRKEDFGFRRARYVRLYITDAGIDDYARIPEFVVYGKPGWRFRADTENWIQNAHVSNLTSIGSRLLVTSTSNAPAIMSQGDLNIDAGSLKKIHVRMRNKTNATTAKLLFITDTDGVWNEAKSVSVTTIANDAAFRDYVFDFSQHASWNGAIEQIRLAPTTTSGDVEIDYIRFTQDDPSWRCFLFPEADLNKDCLVDLNDVSMMAQDWLSLYDLFDFSLMSQSWDRCGREPRYDCP